MAKVIKLRGAKEKNPYFALVWPDKVDKNIGKSVELDITGVLFQEEEYEGNKNFKLKLRANVVTSAGAKPVLVDLGASGLAKGMANSLLSADDLSNIRLSVYTTKTGNMGAGVSDTSKPDNGKFGKDSSQALEWAIAGEERDALITKTETKKGTITDDTDFCVELAKRIKEKFGEKYPFRSSNEPVDGSLFDETPSTIKEEINIEDIPF